MFLIAILMTVVVAAQSEIKADAAPSAGKIQESVERSLTFLQASAQSWADGKNQPGMANGHPIFIKAKAPACASCHHVPMTVLCMTEAKNRGYVVDDKALDYFREWSLDTYMKDRELKPVTQDKFGGSVLSLNTIYLSQAAAAELSPDEATGAALKKFAEHIIVKQEPDGSWKAGRTGYEPPIGDVSEVLTMQAVLVLADAHDKGRIDDASWVQARDRALAWLQKNPPPEDRNQSLTQGVLMAQRFGKPGEIDAAIKRLLEQQNADGGWSQIKGSLSDAMATGQSLYVLALAGADSQNKQAVGRAQAFLLRTQLADGSWWVISREKGRKSLASSHYGSGWATLGLIRTAPALGAPGVQHAER